MGFHSFPSNSMPFTNLFIANACVLFHGYLPINRSTLHAKITGSMRNRNFSQCLIEIIGYVDSTHLLLLLAYYLNTSTLLF